MTEAGFTITHDQISRDHPIKTLGLHPVKIRLHPEVSATVTANVARSDAEAETQSDTGRAVSEEDQHAAEDAAHAETEATMAEADATAEEATDAEEGAAEDSGESTEESAGESEDA